MYKNEMSVRMQDTDAAGILFFANQLVYAHETYEKLLEHIGVSFLSILKDESYFVPIVHAEANYSKSLAVGQPIVIELTVERLGNTSYTLAYSIKAEDGTEVGTCRTVHVTVSRDGFKKIPLPDKLRTGLSKYSDSGS